MFDDRETGVSIVSDESPHAYLRRVTRRWHDRVDTAFGGLDLGSRAGLTDFLVRQASAVLPLEARIEASQAHLYLADWAGRRRGAAIVADLADLGVSPPAWAEAPALSTPLQGLGALYVLEGSKLGGRMLHRRVAASGDPCVQGADRFLRNADRGSWPRFLSVLNAVPTTSAALASLQAGASAAFALFAAAGEAERRPSAAPVFDPRSGHVPFNRP